MAKIQRFSDFSPVNEAANSAKGSIDNPLKVNIESPKFKLEFGEDTVNYVSAGVKFRVSKAYGKVADEKLRYSAILGYGEYDKENHPMYFDWVVYSKTPDGLLKELQRAIPEYKEANPKQVKESREESDDHEDSWRQLDRDEKVDKIMKQLNGAIRKKNISKEDADKIKERVKSEMDRRGPDKIRRELMKRAKEERDLETGSGGEESGGGKKLADLAKEELWKGYKQPIAGFWDTVFGIMG